MLRLPPVVDQGAMAAAAAAAVMMGQEAAAAVAGLEGQADREGQVGVAEVVAQEAVVGLEVPEGQGLLGPADQEEMADGEEEELVVRE